MKAILFVMLSAAAGFSLASEGNAQQAAPQPAQAASAPKGKEKPKMKPVEEVLPTTGRFGKGFPRLGDSGK